MKQKTLAKGAELSGIGLHSNVEVKMTLKPAEPDQGIVFRRTDLEGTPEVQATVDKVVQVERGTVLEHNGVKIRTVEHLLAAAAGLGIDNLIVELDAEEPPATDGSSGVFARLMENAGIKQQDADARIYEVTEPFAVEEAGSRYAVFPSDSYAFSATIEFNHPLIGRQNLAYEAAPERFTEDIASARTFGFYDDAEKLRAAGLALGASVENAVVLTADGLYDGVELRCEDEFVRHKILDMLGDFALVGERIKGQIVAERPGHAGNIALAQEMARRALGQRTARRIDVTDIMKILPHRYPFLLVDRLVEYERGKRVVGIKNVTINEQFFEGHFPGLPIMPGVLIIEAMAQVGGLLLMDTVENPEDKVVYFMSLDKVKFRRPVTPGDQLQFELKMLQQRRSVCRIKGIGRVDGKVVAEAEMAAQVVDR